MWYFYRKISRMVIFPKAKINLGLRITGIRNDGYHDIETLFYPVGLSDALEFVSVGDTLKKDSFVVTGMEMEGSSDNNLVIRALNVLRRKHSFPFLRIHLHKAIPIGAGLGGGSSDGAYIMLAVNNCFNLNIPLNDLKSLALETGSDCPFFIGRVPAFASGRGEILTDAPPVLNGTWLILVNPGISLSTAEAYNNCVPAVPSTHINELIKRPPEEWKGALLNDFEDFAFRKHPILGQIKEDLYKMGAIFSLMSGSGSTVYGIFSERPSVPEALKSSVIYEGRL